jgi:hypothetical protein
MESQESLKPSTDVAGKFATKEAAKQANGILQEAGLSSNQTSLETSKMDADPNTGQIETQGKAEKGALAGAVLGAFFGLLACVIQVLITGSPIFPENSGLSTLAITLGASVIGSICFSLIGVITTEKKSARPLASNPDVPSHEFLVTVDGNQDELEKAVDIIQKNSGKV